MSIVKLITVPGAGIVASLATNSAFSLLKAKGINNTAYQVIERTYIEGFEEGFGESNTKSVNLAQPNQLFRDPNNATARDRVMMESMSHFLFTALAGILPIVGRGSNLVQEEIELKRNADLPKQPKQKGVFQSINELDRRALGYLGIAGLINSLTTMGLNRREEEIADAIERLSKDPKTLAQIRILGKKDGKAMAQERNAQNARTATRAEMASMLQDEREKPRTTGSPDFLTSLLKSAPQGLTSTAASGFAMAATVQP